MKPEAYASTLVRFAVPAVLAACIAIECVRGGDSMPAWLANLAVKTGFDPDKALRMLLALQAALPACRE